MEKSDHSMLGDQMLNCSSPQTTMVMFRYLHEYKIYRDLQKLMFGFILGKIIVIPN